MSILFRKRHDSFSNYDSDDGDEDHPLISSFHHGIAVASKFAGPSGVNFEGPLRQFYGPLAGGPALFQPLVPVQFSYLSPSNDTCSRCIDSRSCQSCPRDSWQLAWREMGTQVSGTDWRIRTLSTSGKTNSYQIDVIFAWLCYYKVSADFGFRTKALIIEWLYTSNFGWHWGLYKNILHETRMISYEPWRVGFHFLASAVYSHTTRHKAIQY